jgi:CRISPR-associated protein Cmr6
MSNYYLPNETAQLLTDARVKQCKNLGLILNKYATQAAIDNSSAKSDWLKGFELDNHIDPQLVKSVFARWSSAVQAMHAQSFTATTDWRMVVGLGGESVLETALTLHHLYGIPFIPGSALKGLTRAYVTGEVEGHKSDKLENDDEDVKRIFGTQNASGSVLFFDAMPVDGKFSLKCDIMNVHYPKYYSEKELPTNTQNPIPVTFLTVENSTFLFSLAPRRSGKDDNDVKLALGWLQDALQQYGVGGKTSAGYGYFQKPTELTSNNSSSEAIATSVPIVDPELAKVERLGREIEAMKTDAVANSINRYYQDWCKLTGTEAKKVLARIIIEKVKKVGREKQSVEKDWYKKLLAFLK